MRTRRTSKRLGLRWQPNVQGTRAHATKSRIALCSTRIELADVTGRGIARCATCKRLVLAMREAA